MGTLYVRVGNRTLPAEEAARLSPKEVSQAKAEAEEANRKRLENMQKALGLNLPKGAANVTLDVTPAGIAARKAAIAAEEAKIAEEAKAAEPAPAQPPAEPAKGKSKKKVTA